MDQAVSLPSNLPEGITADQLYNGPVPEKVVPIKKPLFSEAAQLVQPIPPPVAPVERVGYPAVLSAALDVLSARLLGLLAVVAACAMWSYAVWEPDTTRTVAASLFSLTVLGPLIFLYWKAG